LRVRLGGARLDSTRERVVDGKTFYPRFGGRIRILSVGWGTEITRNSLLSAHS